MFREEYQVPGTKYQVSVAGISLCLRVSVVNLLLMEQDLNNTIALLSRTPAALDALLRGLPEPWTHRNEGGESWTPLQIVGHLVHGDKHDWMRRVKWLLEHGESSPFPPFNRDVNESEGRTLGQLLDTFARVRAASLNELRAMKLTSADLAKRGKHPTFGTVTLSQLLATWAVHDLTHLHQLSRTMAGQYREAVGPWIKFLGVLKCQGHSE